MRLSAGIQELVGSKIFVLDVDAVVALPCTERKIGYGLLQQFPGTRFIALDVVVVVLYGNAMTKRYSCRHKLVLLLATPEPSSQKDGTSTWVMIRLWE